MHGGWELSNKIKTFNTVEQNRAKWTEETEKENRKNIVLIKKKKMQGSTHTWSCYYR